MGPYAAEDKEADDQKVANGEDTGKVKNNNHVESDNLSSKENVGGCCQGVNGVSCCRSAILEQNKEIEETPETHEKGIKICSNWPQLQQRDIRTAVGVLGAVAVAVVAYKLYRRAA